MNYFIVERATPASAYDSVALSPWRLRRIHIVALVFIAVMYFSCCNADPTAALKDIDKAFLPNCRPLPARDADLPPDEFKKAFESRKRYRLVIGVGKYTDNPKDNNLIFATPTAALVDQRLAELGFDPLPSRKGKTAYIAENNATLDIVQTALKEIATETETGGFGVIYWVGHGDLRIGGTDLVLPVADRSVGRGEGIHISTLIDTLANSTWKRKDGILEIPHFLVIIDTCDSGTYLKRIQAVVTDDGVQRIVELPTKTLPLQISMISSTGSGSTTQGFPLKGTHLSAFGAYFAMALREHWTCADQNFDGMLTVSELAQHLQRALILAQKKGGIPKLMVPEYSEHLAFAAYSADFYRQYPGERENLVLVNVEPNSSLAFEPHIPTEVHAAGGIEIPCQGKCTILLSKALSEFTVDSIVDTSLGAVENVPPPRPPIVIAITDLQERKTVYGKGLTVTLK